MVRDVHVERLICRERDVLIARGEFTPILEDYLRHANRWLGDPDGLALTMMRQGLAAAGLHLTCRPRDESTAWTINFAEPPLNVFIAADADAGKVVGRYFEEGVSTEDHNRIFVQAVRRTGKPHLSSLPVTGFDLLGIFEQYYGQSEQTTARFYELDGKDEFMMVVALPDADDDWLMALTLEDALALCRHPTTQQIEIRPVSFGCTCNAQRMLHVVWGMFRKKGDEFFGSDSEVEARCPRCGRAFTITRAEFDAQGRPTTKH